MAYDSNNIILQNNSLQLSNLVQIGNSLQSSNNLGGLQPIAFDNFQRPNENPLSDGGKWSIISGPLTFVAMQLLNDTAQPTSSSLGSCMAFTGAVFKANQYSTMIMGSVVYNTTYCQLFVSYTANNFYRFFWNASGTTQIVRTLSGVQTAILTQTLFPFSSGDTITLTIDRTSNPLGALLSVYRNGTLIESVVDTTPVPGPGVPGFGLFSTGSCSYWAGGNLAY